jgi:hypothetical protein
MATAGDKEQTFARLFRMMDSSFEVEALSALRQAPRMLHEERATFGAILGHTQHLNESNTANIIATYTSRTRHIATALTNAALRARRWSGLGNSSRGCRSLLLPAATTFDADEPSGEGVADPPRWFRLPWKNIPKDLRTIPGFSPSWPPRRYRVTCSFPPTTLTARRVPRPGRAGSPDCRSISALITRPGAFPAAPTKPARRPARGGTRVIRNRKIAAQF